MKMPGVYTSLIYVITAICFLIQLFQTQILTFKTQMLLLLGIVIVWVLLTYMLFHKKKKRFVRAFGHILAIIMSIIFVIGYFGAYLTNSLIKDITTQSVECKDISLIVLDESDIVSFEDVEEKHAFGYQMICSPESTEQMIKEIEQKKGFVNPKKEFDSINAMVGGLYDGKVPMVILDEAYRNILELEWPTFSEDTRVVFSINYYEERINFAKDIDVTEDSFIVLISGIDTYGDIRKISRSDVNILAVVNPKQCKVLLISIPRDYYVPIMSGNNSIGRLDGCKDKLTHTGLFGPECTVHTLEQLFDISINYYVRVNFSSVVEIVDAIGGVIVQSDYAFDGFVVGANECDGKRALEFARERYSFLDGDRQRGKNQMKIIEAIISKLSNPSLQYDYTRLFQTVGGCVDTNVPDDKIKSFIQFQVYNMSAWSVETISVNGSDGKDYSYYGGQNLYVMYPDEDTVDAAKRRIYEYVR